MELMYRANLSLGMVAKVFKTQDGDFRTLLVDTENMDRLPVVTKHASMVEAVSQADQYAAHNAPWQIAA
jgi:hypothetical protein